MSEKKDYIDRETALTTLKSAIKEVNTELDKAKIAFAMIFLSQQQVVDVEHVVRCRDCEHSAEADEEAKELFPCDPEFYCNHLDCPVNGNGFCSAGKQKK